jgi:hypothetical protein
MEVSQDWGCGASAVRLGESRILLEQKRKEVSQGWGCGASAVRLGEKLRTSKFIVLKSGEKKMYKLFSLYFLFSTTELTQNTKT